MNNLKILVVDDIKAMHKIMEKTLSNLMVQDIHYAFNADEAKQYIELSEGMIDLIFTDIQMDGGNGTEIINFCSSHDIFCKIPIVVITAVAEGRFIKRLLKNSAKNVIYKKETLSMFDQKIASVITEVIKREQTVD